MASKVKRCIERIRGRNGPSEKRRKEQTPTGETMTPQEQGGTESSESNSSNETFESTNEMPNGWAITPNSTPPEGLGGNKEDVQQQPLRRIPTVEEKALDDFRYWGPTKSIGEAQLAALLNRTVKTSYDPHFKLINRLNGAFNVAYMMESVQGLKLCVRVPACGFPERWNRTDAELLRATALGMKYIENNSKLPIPRVLAYSVELDNEINAPYTVMSFLEGKSVTFLWDNPGEERSVLEIRRQNILKSLAQLMCTLSTTTFHKAGTLWFPGDDDSQPVVGESYRLDKEDIFTIKRDFLSYPPRESVAELLRGGREKRFAEDGFPEKWLGVTSAGVYILWDLMIEAFLQGGKREDGTPEFVLMQSDFNPQNVLADESGMVTGIIDWDCLESIPRQIGWCSLPHWLEADWYPDYRWPPDIGVENATRPDEYDRYRADYTKYMRDACAGKSSDSIFTSRSHIYQALFDSVESFAKVECFVYNVLTDILPRTNSHSRVHVGDIGEGGFRPGEREWFEARLVRYFAPDQEVQAAE